MSNESFHLFDTDIFKFINSNSQIFQDDFLDNTFRSHSQIMKLLPTSDLLNQKTIDFFNPYGLRSELMTFYQKPFFYGKKAHVDITSTQNFHWYSLNIIITGQGKMCWFNPSDSGNLLRHKDNPNGILYMEYDNLDVLGKPVGIWAEGKVALVKTGIPHHTYNDEPKERLVVSIRWDPVLEWGEAVSLVCRFIENH